MKRWWSALAVLLPTVFLGIMAWLRAWVSDDGFINVRVIQQLMAGNGPVYNLGERVEVGTSTLWLYLVAAVQAGLRSTPTGWIMVVLGLVLSVMALLLAGAGATRLNRDAILPFGLMVFAALPVVWDFATSGLETSLSFAWIAACWTGLVFRGSGELAKPWWLPWLIGLGPLVRPDFALISAGFGLLLLIQGRFSWRSGFAALGLALSTPLAYEIFRAGYYGNLVPNTALVKTHASGALGWAYVWNLVSIYWLVLPLVLAGYLIWRLPVAKGLRVLRSGPVLIGVAHALFVVSIGGDFMHGRFLLPALWLVLLPVAVVPVQGRDLQLVAILTLAWAVVCVGWLRSPFGIIRGVADERSFYAYLVGSEPFALVDPQNWQRRGFIQLLSEVTANPRPEFTIIREDGETPSDRAPYRTENVVANRQVFVLSSIGAAGVVAGTQPYLVDLPALGDPIGSRIVFSDDQVRRPGHGYRPLSWPLARWTKVTTDTQIAGTQVSGAEIVAARATLQCSAIPELLAAVTEPMTPKRFFDNLLLAPKLTMLRIPADPITAQQQLCR